MEIGRSPEIDGWATSLGNQLVPGSVRSSVSNDNGTCNRIKVRKIPGMDLRPSHPHMWTYTATYTCKNPHNVHTYIHAHIKIWPAEEEEEVHVREKGNSKHGVMKKQNLFRNILKSRCLLENETGNLAKSCNVILRAPDSRSPKI